MCTTDTLDTFAGTFTRDLGGYPPQSVTVPLSLSADQMRAIYGVIREIHFFDYASHFNPVPDGVTTLTTAAPYTTYHLEVQNDGVQHAVTWGDSTSPVTDKAVQLRTFFSEIISYLHEHPLYKTLPRSKVGCL